MIDTYEKMLDLLQRWNGGGNKIVLNNPEGFVECMLKEDYFTGVTCFRVEQEDV